MTSPEFCKIARRLLRNPVAPYHEQAVRQEVEEICAEYGLPCKRDRFGNVLVRLQTSRTARPLAFAAHMDHPGFEIIRALSPTRYVARFLGGVPAPYFRRQTPLRLMPDATPAKLGANAGKEKEFEVRAAQTPASPPRFAVWELEDFVVRESRIHGRACDDLIGVAAVLAAIIDLKRSRARVNVRGVISRAEEVGFKGALTVAVSRQLPKDALVISLETSRELQGVKLGCGVILRVGDRTSIFDSEATRFLGEVASGLKARGRPFPFQRALMSGGTCEATAYQEFSYQTAAVCIALGNYHNCGAQNRIEAEYVSVADAVGMANLLAAAARQMPKYPRLVEKLPRRLDALLRRAKSRLIQSD